MHETCLPTYDIPIYGNFVQSLCEKRSYFLKWNINDALFMLEYEWFGKKVNSKDTRCCFVNKNLRKFRIQCRACYTTTSPTLGEELLIRSNVALHCPCEKNYSLFFIIIPEKKSSDFMKRTASTLIQYKTATVKSR